MSDVVFRVLGPVQVVRADGRAVPLTPGTLTDLLATLITSANEIVLTETIIDTVWHARLPEHPKATLHSAVARLRRMIGGHHIQTLPTGYRLHAEVGSLDLLRFERLLAEASQQEAEAALATLTAAVKLWRGAPFENVTSPTLLNDVAPRLTQHYLDACEEWAELCLHAGRQDEVLSRLAALVGRHPFRERMIAQYMLALYRGGRQADAMATYERVRQALRDEMGIDPSPALQELHLKMLRADQSLILKSEQADNAHRPRADCAWNDHIELLHSPVVPRQLPRDLPDFCGRSDEMEQLTGLIAKTSPTHGGTPVVVISGKGGIGKTALAIQAAHQIAAAFPDGQLFVDLQGCGPRPTSTATALASFLRALGVSGNTVPRSTEARVALFRSLTADRGVLIVLDNAASESAVGPLLPASASCAVIVTTRARMPGPAGARRIHLDVLDDDHAVDLLGMILGHGRVAAEHDDARLLATLCGGLPLALRIVGMRLAAKTHWPLATLIARLSDERRRLNELAYGDLDVRATFALSYEALDEPAKSMLRQLSSLEAPDFPAWAGAPLLNIGPDEAADVCERLVDAQLLDPVPSRSPSEIRYQFHDLVRAFVRDRGHAA